MTGVSYQFTTQAKEMIQQNLTTSEEQLQKIIQGNLVQAGSQKLSAQKKKLLNFKVNTQLLQATAEDIKIITDFYSKLQQTPSQFMELTGAKIKIIRSKLPGQVGIEGIVYQETATHLALFVGNKCQFIQKKCIDWIHENVYFVGAARSMRYKKIKKFTF